jgi:hypothetical protein
MHYTDYARRLITEHAKISYELGFHEIGPTHNPTKLPSSPPWNMDWAVIFSGGKYAYLKERWFPETLTAPRSANLGYRKHFSFHYGPANPATDPRGIPLPDPVNFPPIIRIDKDRWPPHVHFHGEDHIPQTRIQGFAITDAGPFEFMKAVIEHRATGVDFDTIMKFKVVP